MEQVAQMLGVELGEIFFIKGSHCKYRLTEKSVQIYDELNSQWKICNHRIMELLNGNDKIIKIPKPILDDAEREYLSNVIKPFRDKVMYIAKYDTEKNQFIRICYCDIDKNLEYMYFPPFKKGTMYKGMEVNKKYSLEDLEL